MTALGSEPSFTRGGPVWPVGLEGLLPRELADPRFFLPEGALERGARDAIEAWHLVDQSPLLHRPPAEPLAPVAKSVQAKRKWWTVAVVASLMIHSAIALFFLEGDEQVLIEGSEQAGITMLGNASEDQVSSGDAMTDTDVTSVTIVQNVMARAVETIEAEAVPVEATDVVETQPVEAEVAMAEPVETVSEVEPEPMIEASAQPVQATETMEEAPPAPAVDPAPQIMAMETIAPESDATAVPPVTDRAPAAISETVEAVAVEAAETVREEPVKEAPPKEVPAPKKAEKKKEPPAPKKAAEKPAPKKAEKKVAEKPAPAAKSKTKAGSGGKNAGDSRKGAADGQEAGTTAASGKNGKTATAGNASVSNYPGKVVSKLRRALRYPSEARAQRLRGEVQVAFTVSSNGSIGGIRVVRSSGSPILDKAAIETVRRAAPFPAIPDGRKNWPFTVPLAFVR